MSTVMIQIDNTYTCGRESSSVVTVNGPEDGRLTDKWWDEHVHEHTGDGHPCGSSEFAVYEATIIGVTGQFSAVDDLIGLIGESHTWEG
jgi:hypothetical protein